MLSFYFILYYLSGRELVHAFLAMGVANENLLIDLFTYVCLGCVCSDFSCAC